MTTTIQKWGNSQGIRIPKVILNQVDLQENDIIEISAVDGSIILKKVSQRKFQNLQERLETFYNKPIDDIYVDRTPEYDWGKPEGDEVW